MAHQLPNAINTAVNVLGTSGLLAARPAGHQRSREAAPDPVAAPPVSAELEGGLAGVRQTAAAVNTAALPDEPGTQVSLAPGPAAQAGAAGQLPDLAMDSSKLGGDPASAAVSSHAGPEADPYHLAA
ncbi:hypothetical protein OEZ86_010629 [Tetradesmus obliquus]|nr:hypothetical protein OEZ86_010629 [Tetradesmus obliquus]